MDLNDLINQIERYDGDIKRMEMDKHLEKLRGGDNMFDPMKELMDKFAKEEEGQQKENEKKSTSSLFNYRA